MADRFTSAVPNKADNLYYLFFIAIAVLTLWNQTATQTTGTFGYIYTPIISLSITLFGIAYITKGKKLVAEVTYGKISTDQELYRNIVIGLALGGFIMILSLSQSLSFALPPLPLAIAGSGATLAYVLIDGFVGVDIEETFIQGILVPTFATGFKQANAIILIGFFGGLIFLTIFQINILAYLFFGLAFVFLFLRIVAKKSTLFTGDIPNHLVAAVLAGFVFGLFHSWAYGSSANPIGLLTTSALFGIGFALVNLYNQSTISSRLIHSMSNLSLLILVGIPISLALLVIITYVLMILTIWKSRNRVG